MQLITFALVFWLGSVSEGWTMRPIKLSRAAVVAFALSVLNVASAHADEAPVEVQAVDALVALFGKHPGVRANHAKGILLEGSFTASPEAASLSRAPHLQGGAVPVTVRFSDATGLPDIADGSKKANPHGMAIKFHLPGGAETDIVANSLQFFPVSTVADFRDLLLAIAASGPGTSKPTKLDMFFTSHPAAARALATTATPASFATEHYFGIDAFRFVNRAGAKRFIRYRIQPLAGVSHLESSEASNRAPDFLMDEIRDRLKQGPVQFRLLAQIAAPGDPTNDPAVAWPEDRPLAELGVLTLAMRHLPPLAKTHD